MERGEDRRREVAREPSGLLSVNRSCGEWCGLLLLLLSFAAGGRGRGIERREREERVPKHRLSVRASRTVYRRRCYR
jgi:hypothetical protein